MNRNKGIMRRVIRKLRRVDNPAIHVAVKSDSHNLIEGFSTPPLVNSAYRRAKKSGRNSVTGKFGDRRIGKFGDSALISIIRRSGGWRLIAEATFGARIKCTVTELTVTELSYENLISREGAEGARRKWLNGAVSRR